MKDVENYLKTANFFSLTKDIVKILYYILHYQFHNMLLPLVLILNYEKFIYKILFNFQI